MGARRLQGNLPRSQGVEVKLLITLETYLRFVAPFFYWLGCDDADEFIE